MSEIAVRICDQNKQHIKERSGNEKSKEILRSIYNGALEQPITINGKFIQPKRKPEPKKVIKPEPKKVIKLEPKKVIKF